MIGKFLILLNTVKYLKFIQIYYRLFYLVRNKFRKFTGFKYNLFKGSNSTALKLSDSIHCYKSYLGNGEFVFLNLHKKFNDKIDWNFSKYGKLWTYNLNYFEYLNQESFSEHEGLEMIFDFIDNLESVKDGLEPFPISLRGINWTKFLTKYKINERKIDDCLYAQYYILLDNLEYHLLGNHLLENGFSLLFGAYYFQDEKLYNKAAEILKTELDEQILDDGAHFELSPMYHQLMLFRLLDCINLVVSNSLSGISERETDNLKKFLITKAEMMLGWLKCISYENGNIPLFNDSANFIAPSSIQLFEYAQNLKFKIKNSTLKESGYRKISKENYECIVDIGQIGASYIPGHTHADTFNFELYIKNKPFIVDTGTSTYEIGERRNFERSTKAHNTVEINGENSSEVWSGFRVADRAEIVKMEESQNYIEAVHDGYKKRFGILHTRRWKFEEDKITITDILNENCEAVARLHFHPDITEEEIKQKIVIQNSTFNIQNYKCAFEFNKTEDALVLEVPFESELGMEIYI